MGNIWANTQTAHTGNRENLSYKKISDKHILIRTGTNTRTQHKEICQKFRPEDGLAASNPKPWKTCRGAIIPKPQTDGYTDPRAFRIISLTSNLLKLLEHTALIYLVEKLKIDSKTRPVGDLRFSNDVAYQMTLELCVWNKDQLTVHIKWRCVSNDGGSRIL